MKVCIYGAGAIGIFFGQRLAKAGCTVSAVARGETLKALTEQGLRVKDTQGLSTAPVQASADPAELGVQDLVILAVKGQSLPSIAGQIAPLIGPDTVVLSAMNGLPWWFFQGFGGAYAGAQLKSVDPEGQIAAAIPADRVLGSVIHMSCQHPEPGLSKHVMGLGLILGEPNGSISPRLERVADAFRSAGFEVSLSEQIQKDIWYKLWGNMTMNPISALTGATADRILDEPQTKAFCLQVMAEAAAIGAAIGSPIAQSGEDRMAVTRKLGAFKTSMLQDAEAGRRLEVEPLVGAVQEIGRMTGIPTPYTDILLGLTRLKDQSLAG
ncbi:MAG: 2-dehydropantoate 2-reductase [Gammaproteobacteria bacterium]|nr:2-dehydropantoate 2-reductase [Gammaproteobacteria bacterium]